ncbi:MAG TPA: SIS domain-containing protein [Trebonia sp.]|nr:SIS domain-containing protein [Trebonia sp.]
MRPGTLMTAEIAEQPTVLGRLAARHAEFLDQIRAALPERLAGTALLARGSSDNVAVYGRYLIELTSRRPAGLAAPSLHTRYGADADYGGYLVVALSQSGATPEIVQAASVMRRSGAVVVAITNEPDSPLARACQVTLPTGAGPELAVPATKTVTAQMLAIVAVAAAFDPGVVPAADLAALPAAVERVVADDAPARALAARWERAGRLVVTGRGMAYAAALETALKIKESARVHAEGLSSADLLHGPIAALDDGLPVLIVAGGERFAADEAELAARLARIGVPTATCGPAPGADLPVPEAGEILQPVLATVRGQQLALAAALRRGLDPDAPAGLAKVTATH